MKISLRKIKAITFILEKFLNQRNLHMTFNEPKENCIWKQLEDFLDKLQRNAFWIIAWHLDETINQNKGFKFFKDKLGVQKISLSGWGRMIRMKQY